VGRDSLLVSVFDLAFELFEAGFVLLDRGA